jgi:hypothetical protein
MLLTLYSSASGADQSISLLRIEKALPGQDILALPFSPLRDQGDLSQHFIGDSSTRLYVNTMVHVEDLLAMEQGLKLGEDLARSDEVNEAQHE